MTTSPTTPEAAVRRVTLVTGGSRGIGAAVCRRLAAEGHAVGVGYHRDAAAADAVVATVRQAGGTAEALPVDTADGASVDAFFEAAAARLGPVTGLVNNAGVPGPVGPLAEADPEGLRRALEVNLLGYLLCARRAVQELSRADGPRGGAVVNVSSAAATLGSPGEYVHYAAAKAAVDTLTVGLAKEVGPLGIRVNCVAPGTVHTEFHLDPERPTRIGATVPLGRSAQPEEIAGAVAWLLSDDASYASGAILRVAGGR